MSDIVGRASAERYWEGRWRDEAKRVAELENAILDRVVRLEKADARVAELERALGQIKRMKLFPNDKVNRFTLAAAINVAANALAVHAVLNAPANAKEVMPNPMAQSGNPESAEARRPDKTTPRPAQSPAGAVLEILQREIRLTSAQSGDVCQTCGAQVDYTWRVKPGNLEHCADLIAAELIGR